MTEIICYMAICMVHAAKIDTCNPTKMGSKELAQKMVLQINSAGQVLVTECVKPGEQPSLTWFKDKVKKEEDVF